MALDGSNQLKKNRPLILKEQPEPLDSDLAPGEFTLFPKILSGKVELFVKGKDAMGVVSPATNLTTNGAPVGGDSNGEFVQYIQTLTIAHINNKKITLIATPASVGEVSLTPLGGLEQRSGIDFEILNGNELSWDGLGLDGDLSNGDQILIKFFSV